jgi:hypothetical protein
MFSFYLKQLQCSTQINPNKRFSQGIPAPAIPPLSIRVIHVPDVDRIYNQPASVTSPARVNIAPISNSINIGMHRIDSPRTGNVIHLNRVPGILPYLLLSMTASGKLSEPLAGKRKLFMEKRRNINNLLRFFETIITISP